MSYKDGEIGSYFIGLPPPDPLGCHRKPDSDNNLPLLAPAIGLERGDQTWQFSRLPSLVVRPQDYDHTFRERRQPFACWSECSLGALGPAAVGTEHSGTAVYP